MAIYHLSATAVQRSKGHSAVAGAAYRSGTLLYEERTRQAHDYQRKRGVVYSEIIAPEDAPQWVYDRGQLWNRAELAEKRHDAQPAREIRLGLPHELDDAQRAELVVNYARDVFVSSGMVADISIHRPDRHGDDRNDHAHIYLTMRELDGDEFSRTKQRDWNRTETLETWREAWADYQNAALEKYGHDARVDHRSYEAQGITREATRHLGKAANAIEREGKESRIGNENRAVAERNQYLDRLVNDLADLDRQIAFETEREFFTPPQEKLQPVLQEAWNEPPPESLFEQKGVSYREWLAMEPEQENKSFPATTEPQPPREPQGKQSIWDSDITTAYRMEPAASAEEESQRQERRWYEDFYATTVGIVQQYWQRFVKGDKGERNAPDRNEMEYER